MGSCSFAVPALLSLIKYHQVTAIFTQEPKPQGRGLKLQISQVHQHANNFSIPVHTPKTLLSESVFELISSIQADLIVVCSYGLIVPENILYVKRYGCLNIHPSALPKYRGAAPLQRCILAGDTKTAVCIMQMDKGLDTGPILLKQEIEISDDTTYVILRDRCAEIGADLLLQTIAKIDILPRVPQGLEGVSYAKKLTKLESKINWHDSARKIDRQVRATNPWPGSYFANQGEQIKVLRARPIIADHDFKPGLVINDTLHIACAKDILAIELLQRPGSKALETKDFLKGYVIESGSIVS
jgi:methionyl-tRNA formyltransferase